MTGPRRQPTAWRARSLGLFAALAALVGVGAAGAAAALDWQRGPLHGRVGGYLLETTMVGVEPTTATLPRSDVGLTVLRLRPVADAAWDDAARIEIGWDVLPVIGSGAYVQRLAVAPPNRLRVWDFDALAHDGSGFDLQHNLDRLVLQAQLGPLGLKVGRQAIGHGGARLLTTADLFGPFGPGSIATEFKRGVDAVRLTLPAGDRLELEAIAVGHRAALDGEAADVGLRDGIYLLRLGLSVPETLDLSLLAGVSYRLPTLAWAVNGDVWGAGWYVEGSARWDGDAKGSFGGDEDASLQLRATVGLDRQWTGNTRTVLELAYQSTGAKDVAGMFAAATRLPTRVGEAFLLGRLHAAAMVATQVRDLHSLNLAAICNLDDGSVLLMPGAGVSISDEVTLGLGALLPLGKRPLVALGDLKLPRSEFGSAPLLAYLDLRLGF